MKFGKMVTIARDFTTTTGTAFKKGEKATLIRRTEFTHSFRTEDGRTFNLPFQGQRKYIKE